MNSSNKKRSYDLDFKTTYSKAEIAKYKQAKGGSTYRPNSSASSTYSIPGSSHTIRPNNTSVRDNYRPPSSSSSSRYYRSNSNSSSPPPSNQWHRSNSWHRPVEKPSEIKEPTVSKPSIEAILEKLKLDPKLDYSFIISRVNHRLIKHTGTLDKEPLSSQYRRVDTLLKEGINDDIRLYIYFLESCFEKFKFIPITDKNREFKTKQLKYYIEDLANKQENKLRRDLHYKWLRLVHFSIVELQNEIKRYLSLKNEESETSGQSSDDDLVEIDKEYSLNQSEADIDEKSNENGLTQFLIDQFELDKPSESIKHDNPPTELQKFEDPQDDSDFYDSLEKNDPFPLSSPPPERLAYTKPKKVNALQSSIVLIEPEEEHEVYKQPKIDLNKISISHLSYEDCKFESIEDMELYQKSLMDKIDEINKLIMKCDTKTSSTQDLI